jgi:hypothetical protein
MQSLPQINSQQRPIRVRFAQPIPAVLRSQDGICTKGELQVVSATGGLLSLPALLNRNHRTKLLFVTSAGPVLAVAEMLDAITYTQQPFRFVRLDGGAVSRLQSTIRDAVYPANAEDEWLRRYRSTLENRTPNRLRRMLAEITRGFDS